MSQHGPAGSSWSPGSPATSDDAARARSPTTPGVARVIGVDVVPPRGDLGNVSFVRADIRNPVIAKVIAKEDVDTVVHMSVIATPGSAGGRETMKELNVIGTMQLLAAAQSAPRLQRLVVKSTTTVYGASSRDPAMFTEDMEPRRQPRSGYAKDVAEIEGYVRGFARRRPDVAVTLLRCANVIGPHVQSPITSYFRLPVVPTVLGFDPRLQFLHEEDLLGVVQHAALGRRPRHLQRRRRRRSSCSPRPYAGCSGPACRCPAVAVGNLGSVLRQARLADFSPEQLGLLTFGRGVDTTRMREVLGFHPRYTTAEAFADFAAPLSPTGGRTTRLIERASQLVDGAPARLERTGADRG